MAEEKMKGKAKAKRVVAKPVKRVLRAQPMRRAAISVKGVSKKVNPKTVRGKIALYQKTATKFQSAARQMLRSGVRDMQAGVRAVQLGIKEQMNRYKEGVAAMLSGIAAMQSSILEQAKENQEYVRQFYG